MQIDDYKTSGQRHRADKRKLQVLYCPRVCGMMDCFVDYPWSLTFKIWMDNCQNHLTYQHISPKDFDIPFVMLVRWG